MEDLVLPTTVVDQGRSSGKTAPIPSFIFWSVWVVSSRENVNDPRSVYPGFWIGPYISDNWNASLFLIFINDLDVEDINSNILKFAHDTKIFKEVRCSTDKISFVGTEMANGI